MGTLPHSRRRLACAVAGAAFAGILLTSAEARADDPCRENSNGLAVPGCVTQAHSDTLKADQTQDIDIYCPPEAPYYWGGWVDNFTSKWHVITENLITSNAQHAHFKISNTALSRNSYTVTIGCSPTPEWGTCNGNLVKVADPKCPISSQRQDCTGAPWPKCWEVWTETCTAGATITTYSCTDANPLGHTCITCSG